MKEKTKYNWEYLGLCTGIYFVVKVLANWIRFGLANVDFARLMLEAIVFSIVLTLIFNHIQKRVRRNCEDNDETAGNEDDTVRH